MSPDSFQARADSFVVETDVHHPTDVSLLWDAMRSSWTRTARLCTTLQVPGWRQSKHLLDGLTVAFLAVRRRKGWNDRKRVKAYLRQSRIMASRMKSSHERLRLEKLSTVHTAHSSAQEDMVTMAEKLMDQVSRRLLKGEKIPHDEKIFSVFEPHTRWISKGKAKSPVELGVPVTVLEDLDGFVLGTYIQWDGGDVDSALPLVIDCLARYPDLKGCSFDRGFHSLLNRFKLDKLLDLNALPKKGHLNGEDKNRESESSFKEARRLHPGIESAINHLEHHGMSRIRSHGRDGFERAVALATLASNFHRLGMHIRAELRRRPAGRTRVQPDAPPANG